MATVRRPSEQQSTLEGGFQEPVKRVPSLPPKKCKDIQTGSVNCSDSMLQKGPKFGCLYPNCGQNFDKPSALSVHMLSHRCGKPFVCSHKGCNRSFSQATTLEKHEISHQKGTEPRRMLNSSVSNSFTCPQRECGQQFTSRSSLQIHIRSTHAVSVSKGPGGKDLNQQKSVPIESPVSSSKTSKKQFACKHSGCNQSFDHGLALRAHLAAGAPGLAAETAYYQSLLRGLVRALGRLGGRSPALAAVLGHLPAYAQAKNAVDTMLPMPMPTSVPSNKRQRSPAAPATDPPLKAPSNEDSGQTTSENWPENANVFSPDPSTPLTVSAQSTLRAHAQQQLEGSSAASDSEEEEDEEEVAELPQSRERQLSLNARAVGTLDFDDIIGDASPGAAAAAVAAHAPTSPAGKASRRPLPPGTVRTSAVLTQSPRGPEDLTETFRTIEVTTLGDMMIATVSMMGVPTSMVTSTLGAVEVGMVAAAAMTTGRTGGVNTVEGGADMMTIGMTPEDMMMLTSSGEEMTGEGMVTETTTSRTATIVIIGRGIMMTKTTTTIMMSKGGEGKVKGSSMIMTIMTTTTTPITTAAIANNFFS
eukprot:CAMPEP_0206382784 /NCGR_PEP_ID=MMETSP0294-20121207/13506_1 /ASSEMBLY_ACC=CAM_ASM_000327 /TAXON_ID=39354 /ORGANISM="Heterosigma akashiwo, Strain CCMP2393" /LENGTH=586 /DNA_ID=CAMNT_0053832611 /DNA_START=331 /DNA_END=2089 /DNA_ORIENTATION=-